MVKEESSEGGKRGCVDEESNEKKKEVRKELSKFRNGKSCIKKNAGKG